VERHNTNFIPARDPEPGPVESNPVRVQDKVEALLRREPSITDGDRAVLYDAYHLAPTPEALAEHLQKFEIPSTLEAQLIAAKAEPPATPAPRNAVEAAIQKMQQLDPDALHAAETHPTVLLSLIDSMSHGEE
jgi:hypothetical protein